MMNYEMFKEIVSDRLADYLPEPYKDRTLTFGSVEKINGAKDSVSFMVREGDPRVSPTMYLDDMYENYLKIGDIDLVLQRFANDLCSHFEEGPMFASKFNLDEIRENVVFSLINAEQNRSYLEKRPHRLFQDLAVVYDYHLEHDLAGVASVPITHDVARMAEISEQEMFELATENTKRIFPTVIKPMSYVIAELLDNEIVPFDLKEAIEQEMEIEEPMFVITNQAKHKGAAGILYEDGLHDLSELVGNDLYILPSSLHELIAISVDMMDPENLAEMVHEINETQVDLGERLSNQVYHYDRDTRTVSMATDTPNKSLSGHTEEKVQEVTRPVVR